LRSLPEMCVVVLYVLLIGLLNLGLGFAVARYLGRRYRDVMRAHFLSTLAAAGEESEAGDGSRSVPADEDPPAFAPQQRVPGQEAASTSAPSPAETVDGLLGEVRDFGERLDQVDKAAGGSPAELNSPDRQGWLDSLLDATGDYAAQRDARQTDFAAALEHAELALERDPLWSVWMRQGEQIRRVNEEGAQLRTDPDEEQGWQAMGEHTSELLGTATDLGESLERASELLRSVEDPSASASSEPNHEKARRKILERWADVRPEPDALPCVAVIDVDNTDRMNQRFGRGVTDHVLDALWEFVQAEQRHDATASRVDGQRFVLLFADGEAKRAANIVERIRQSIGKMDFVHGEHEIRTTVSCSLSAPTPGEDVEDIFARARASLDEAKRYGRNRTFLHSGDFPAPVVPPTLSLEESRIPV